MTSFFRWIRIVLAWLLFAVLAPALAVAAFFGAATLTASLLGLLLGALLACLAAGYGTARLALRATGTARRHRRALGLAGGATLLAALIGGVVLFVRPSYEVATMPERRAPFEMVKLSTGSRVGVARIASGKRDPSVKSPLVFLHGGPGAYVRDSDLDLLAAIAAEGIEVVTFDQAGGGVSDRLGVREYSLARAVADLDALRDQLGAERLSLLGQSWGGMLAYEYARTHPERVDRLVLTSSGLLSDQHKKLAMERTAARDAKPPSFPTHFYAAAMLFKVNPDAAVAFTSRDELDATWRKAAAGNVGRWYCKEDAASVPDPDQWMKMPAFDGYQGFALKMEMEARTAPAPHPEPVPPTLMLRGDCDFIPWGAARELRDALDATLVTIPAIGHAMWPAKGDLVRDLTVAHLKGHPLPSPAYDGDDDPALLSSR